MTAIANVNAHETKFCQHARWPELHDDGPRPAKAHAETIANFLLPDKGHTAR